MKFEHWKSDCSSLVAQPDQAKYLVDNDERFCCTWEAEYDEDAMTDEQLRLAATPPCGTTFREPKISRKIDQDEFREIYKEALRRHHETFKRLADS